MIKIILLAVFLSSCGVRETWGKRETFTCISIKEEMRFGEMVWYIRWESELGGVVYEFSKQPPLFKVGDKTTALIL